MTVTFQKSKERFQRHNCPSEADVCDCSFDFFCESCGKIVVTAGESMPEHIGDGGVCVNCLHADVLRVDAARPTSPANDRHYESLEGMNRWEEHVEFSRYHSRKYI